MGSPISANQIDADGQGDGCQNIVRVNRLFCAVRQVAHASVGLPWVYLRHNVACVCVVLPIAAPSHDTVALTR